MSLRRGTITFLAGGAGGAAIAYLLDPDRGKARRHRLRDQVAAFFRQAWQRAGRQGRRLSGEAYGAWYTATHETPAESEVDDRTLGDRVESELFMGPDVPKGQINVNVEDGVVVLRGQVQTLEQIQNLEKTAREIAGVRGVENLLHLPGTPAPNKAEAREAG